MIQQYDYDVFVSYSHRDDRPLGGKKEGWVAQLKNYLVDRLSMKLGRDARVFMDYRLNGNEPLTEQLMQAVQSSAALLVACVNS